MNRFEDAIARELAARLATRPAAAHQAVRTRSLRALARWAAAAVPPGALPAHAAALVLERLEAEGGDPDALAERVMAEVPGRFGRHWDAGPAH
jgi:hypothetical protein